MRIEAKLDELGLVLPEAARVPPSVQLPFPWVRVHGNRLVRLRPWPASARTARLLGRSARSAQT